MKVRKYGRSFAAFLVAAAVILNGCGQENVTGKGPGAAADSSADAGMGRYVEEFAQGSVGDGGCASLTCLEDGRIAAFFYSGGPLVSSDEGKSWEPWQEEWYWENCDYRSFECAAIAPDGTMFVGYYDYSDKSVEEKGQSETVGGESELGMDYQLIAPDGSSRTFDLEKADDEYGNNFITGCWYAPDGTLYVADYNRVYEVSGDSGALTALFETKEGVEQLCFLENDLMLAADASGVLIYDRKNRTMGKSDEALDAFVKTRAEVNGGKLKYFNGSYNLYLTAGEGDSLYLLCDEGIYSHVLGGGMLEKVLEGSLCALGDPSQNIFGMLTLSGNRFLVLYLDAVGMFSYDADAPALPEKELRVYSLKKDDVVQQAVRLFLKEHPDVYVNYEVGLDENTGQTTEDVIKTLNIEILAGHGPDVLILDGFPLNSYIEKGLLKDISGILEKAEEKEAFFHNIANAFETDEGLFVIPMRCRIPAMIGPEDEMKGTEDLKGLVDASESLRRKKADGSVTGTKAERPTLRLLAMSSAPAWENEDGSVNLEEIEEFFVQAKRFFEAESAGLDAKEQEAWSEVYLSGPNGTMRNDAWMLIDNNAYQAFLEENRMGLGYVNDMWAMGILLAACKEGDGLQCDTLKGQSQQVFYPYTIAGISASSKETELAEQFVETMLSADAASLDGFSVNRVAEEENVRAYNDVEGNILSAMMGNDQKQMIIYRLTEGEIDWIYGVLENLRTPYLQNETLETAVLETGEKFLRGELELEAAVREVQSRVKLSMAE